MDIIALTAMSGAATSAPPSPSPAANGGDFARSLEQAAGRQAPSAAAAQPTSPRAADAQTPAATLLAAPMPLAISASVLPSLSLAGSAAVPEAQEEAPVHADELPEDTVAEQVAMLLQAPLPSTPALPAAAAPSLAQSDSSDDLQRIRSRLQAIESAGQLPLPGAAGAAPAGQPAQVTQSPPTAGATAATVTMGVPANIAHAPGQPAQFTSSPLPAGATTPGTPANAAQSSGQAASAAVEQDGPALPDAPVAASQGRPESAAGQSGPAPTPAEGAWAGENLAPSLASTADGATFPLAGASLSAGGTATSSPATAGASTAASLTAPLASPEWQRGLGQHLLGLQQRGEREIELHLHPAELGPLSISLKIGESGAQAQFLSAHPQVRAAVEQAIPQLREALAEQGIALGETSVGERQQQQRDERPASWSGGTSPAGGGNEEAVPGSPETVAPRPLRLEGIDLYA
ncbi:Flagellar hook-length control protein [Azotobacter vinelandii CA]|uniref:Flagellar hook-length control protein n=2 Tax=Azotobacter vinelandii TaxID=354 RepID=C1DHL0_AZOVD|nr:flagellar hook-length control protein FliK [Azotobacter vinelandii]ACO78605.1 Flagellar hook-length control protein [Azotobacter vinelandii DJ]AGK13499.1 Flagellar hook-length control protein [Azotobacter vinelandii CA]AGK17913.1 Flagellar hook-length control protein [Azotobacter vinelandii CA6]SFX89887.1 flagellar hook-length control protein FliK [Azotobacter vinelandii]GLK58226.1 hypothetical protein GCM10017624_03830 [Azotobacter vinelandii]